MFGARTQLGQVALIAATIAASSVACCSEAVEADQPWITGDRALVEMAQKAREANARNVAKHGKLTAIVREFLDKRTVPSFEATVHCAWLGDKFLSDVSVSMPLEGRPPPKDAAAAREWEKRRREGKEMPATNCRVMYDGRRYLIYWPKAQGSKGHLTILPTLDQLYDTLYAQHGDQRPQTQWLSQPIGPAYPWTNLTQLDNRKNARVKRWQIDLKESTVTLARHVQWQEGNRTKEGLRTLEINLDLHGAIVSHNEAALDGGTIGPERQRVKATFNWEKLGDISVLRSYEFVEDMHDSTTRKTYTVRDFSLAEQSASDFVEAALRVRPGARVEDRSLGKTYVYGGRPVSQADLDRVIEKAKRKSP